MATDLVGATFGTIASTGGKSLICFPVQDSGMRDRKNNHRAQDERCHGAHESIRPAICHHRFLRQVGRFAGNFI
jgi:hypothetical protein